MCKEEGGRGKEERALLPPFSFLLTIPLMPKRPAPAKMAATDEAVTPVQAVRNAADSLFRAAQECCHQHERVSRVHDKSNVEDELQAAQKACDHCDETLESMAKAYEAVAASVHPKGDDEKWWHSANAMWLASKEYLRRHGGADKASKDVKSRDKEQLDALHMEFELEASALLGLRHAAEAYQKHRPSAA